MGKLNVFDGERSYCHPLFQLCFRESMCTHSTQYALHLVPTWHYHHHHQGNLWESQRVKPVRAFQRIAILCWTKTEAQEHRVAIMSLLIRNTVSYCWAKLTFLSPQTLSTQRQRRNTHLQNLWLTLSSRSRGHVCHWCWWNWRCQRIEHCKK